MQAQYPIYIVSKGRADTRLTVRALDQMGVPYRVIIEHDEWADYAAVINPLDLVVLDPKYQAAYETCDEQGDFKPYGPGPARNMAWDMAQAEGAPWHWVMDDNIVRFYRLNKNTKIQCLDGTLFYVMEAWADRYTNVLMAGPNYEHFVVRRERKQPVTLNTRIYSCNLIRTDAPFRWRGRYNEDTDLSLRMLKAGWCTALFNAFLQNKVATQRLAGGNTDAFYAKEGTLAKSQMLVRLHPDVSKLVWRYKRWHHDVDYRPFRHNALRLKPGVQVSGTDNFGMALKEVVK